MSMSTPANKMDEMMRSTSATDVNVNVTALLISGTSSGVGKTTVTVGIMAAFAKRGYVVQPFKCGPDFLDGMHHEAAIEAGEREWSQLQLQQQDEENGTSLNDSSELGGTEELFMDTPTATERSSHGSDKNIEPVTSKRKENCSSDCASNSNNNIYGENENSSSTNAQTKNNKRRCINLDGWMMGSSSSVRESFHRHARGADICILEGAMGLHDSRDGTSDEGSAAQIAKLLDIPVILVVDGSMMARSVAAMALGYALFDPDMRLGAVVVNKVGGPVHIAWIAEALALEGKGGSDGGSGRGRLKDAGTGEAVCFAGALPRDASASVAERHLGLAMPKEKMEQEGQQGRQSSSSDADAASSSLRRYEKLAALVEEHLDLDALLTLGKTACRQPIPVPELLRNEPLLPPPQTNITYSTPNPPRCRIGIADDEAFCFYYTDNLHLLRLAGAELVPFSPLVSPHLPARLDALYIGGGYPELHATKLEGNKSLRDDIRSFCEAGGLCYAECGGLMYLSQELFPYKSQEGRKMCGVLPMAVRMTPHAKMYYADVEFTNQNPVFPAGGQCRGQKFHFSEIVEEEELGIHQNAKDDSPSPLLVTPQLPGALPEKEGHAKHNTFASYFHLHFASYRAGGGGDVDGSATGHDNTETTAETLADHFVRNAISCSPCRKAFAVSFVSAATDIVFALGAESALAGVTSVCPIEAKYAPRQVICRSPIDAASMTSEEVDEAMEKMKSMRLDNGGKGPPGYWIVDEQALRKMKPQIAFIQNTCDICDASTDDVLHALHESGLDGTTVTIQVSPTTLEGMFSSISDIAKALNVEESGVTLIDNLQKRLDRIQNELAKVDATRPSIVSLEGLSPLCTGGNWLPDMKYAAGCIDALGDTGGCLARHLSWDEILRADPDILVISPCSATPARTLNEIHLLASASDFWKLRSVQEGNVYIIDHGSFSRPGPSLLEGVEMMATLFRKIPAPFPSMLKKWQKEALKYECSTVARTSVAESTSCISHCTTELASRFVPCFEGTKGEDTDELAEDKRSEMKQDVNLCFCKVTRCTIPGFDLPSNRSAHCMVPIRRRGTKHSSVLLLGGENEKAERLNDTWELHSPSSGWASASEYNDEIAPALGKMPTWEYLRCGKIAGEDVPTKRSNHAAVACGNYVLVFGGWGVDNMTPLTHCELLHIETLCWTHCSTQGSSNPSARGNPSLVYSEERNEAILFGGWNGVHALNDLWALDMDTWEWRQTVQDLYHSNEKVELTWPSPRTDHTAVLWEKNKECQKMIVFGGNVEGVGPCAELWELEISLSSTSISSNDLKQGGGISSSWRILTVTGPCPPARTSHTASMVGSGDSSSMIVVGGTDSSRGAGRESMVCDAWILNLHGQGGDESAPPTWLRIDWSGSGVDRCRHSMAFVGDTSIVVFGGYDGDASINDQLGVWQGNLCNLKGSSVPPNTERYSTKQDTKRFQERWDAETPVRVEDLPPEILAKAERSKLPGALYKALHRYAVSKTRDTYIDPSSGYSVFTQVYLKRRQCCGNGCRHCPYGHINVPSMKKKTCIDDPKLEW